MEKEFLQLLVFYFYTTLSKELHFVFVELELDIKYTEAALQQDGSRHLWEYSLSRRQEGRVTMASTSNATHGDPDNYPADLKFNSPSPPNSVDGSQVYQTAEFEGWSLDEQEDTNYVPKQLLSLSEQEENDLLLLYPEAKVQKNYITTEQYLVVVKKFLFQLKMSGNRMEGVDHPQAYARLLRRLSRELRSLNGGFKLNCSSDPADYDACLGEMINDIEMTWREDGEILKEILKELEETYGSNGCVCLRRN